MLCEFHLDGTVRGEGWPGSTETSRKYFLGKMQISSIKWHARLEAKTGVRRYWKMAPRNSLLGENCTPIQVSSEGKRENTSRDRFLYALGDQAPCLPWGGSGPLVQVPCQIVPSRQTGRGCGLDLQPPDAFSFQAVGSCPFLGMRKCEEISR